MLNWDLNHWKFLGGRVFYPSIYYTLESYLDLVYQSNSSSVGGRTITICIGPSSPHARPQWSIVASCFFGEYERCPQPPVDPDRSSRERVLSNTYQKPRQSASSKILRKWLFFRRHQALGQWRCRAVNIMYAAASLLSLAFHASLNVPCCGSYEISTRNSWTFIWLIT